MVLEPRAEKTVKPCTALDQRILVVVAQHRAPGTFAALNGSFRRILRAEDKSERTVKSYTEAVRLAERGHPLNVEGITGGDVQYPWPWTGRDRALRP